MKRAIMLVLFVCSAAIACRAGDDAANVTEATVCQILSDPMAYNGKMVRVRGRVQLAYQDFELSAKECDPEKAGVWLEYGKGPRHQPTIWCCGTPPRDKLAVVRDKNFNLFDRYLTAQSNKPDCYNCYIYEVTATLTGRIDAVEQAVVPDGERQFELAHGFGNLGSYRVRLVIHSVSNVQAKDVSDKYR